MWEKEAECPSISMYSALIRCSLSFLGEMFFSLIRDLSVLSSWRMMRSSSCLDLVSPMLLMSSCRSFDMLEEAILI